MLKWWSHALKVYVHKESVWLYIGDSGVKFKAGTAHRIYKPAHIVPILNLYDTGSFFFLSRDFAVEWTSFIHSDRRRGPFLQCSVLFIAALRKNSCNIRYTAVKPGYENQEIKFCIDWWSYKDVISSLGFV